MTLNSALSQNWVGCTVSTPRTQVARTLRTQSPCRGRCCAHSKLVVRMSGAQPTQVARSTCAGRAHSTQVVGACRDLLPLPCPGQVATSSPGRDLLEANPCRDFKLVSRHRLVHSRSRPQKWGRDTNHHHAA